MALLRAVLVVALALGAGAVSAPAAFADGIERPKRAAPRPAPRRPVSRPAPSRPAPEPEARVPMLLPPVESGPETVQLSDAFFSGPLSGGVGYSYGAGGQPGGGGGFFVTNGATRASGFSMSTPGGHNGGGFSGAGVCGSK